MLRRKGILGLSALFASALFMITVLFGFRSILNSQQINLERLAICDGNSAAENLSNSSENAEEKTGDRPKPCISDSPFFAAGRQTITVTATANPEDLESINTVSAEVVSVNKSGEKVSMTEQTVEFKVEFKNEVEITFAIEDVLLDVGVYELSITSISEQEQTSHLKETIEFVVLPSRKDVLKRLNSEETVSNFKDTIDEIIICADPGSEAHCASHTNTIPTTEIVLADTLIASPNVDEAWLGNSPEITYTLRLLEDGAKESETEKSGAEEGDDFIPEILFQNTLKMEENTSILGIPLGIGSSGLPPGSYDLTVMLETLHSKPVRAMFTVIP